MKFTNAQNFNNLEITIMDRNENVMNFSQMMEKAYTGDRRFNFRLSIDGNEYVGKSFHGADAMWFRIENNGIKIIAENKKYNNLNEAILEIKRLKSIESSLFPKIHWAEICEYNNEKFLLVCMEHIENKKSPSVGSLNWSIPEEDRVFAERHLQCSLNHSKNCIEESHKHHLLLEDEWYKPINSINGKIIDFHRTEYYPQRYKFPSNGRSPEELHTSYSRIVDRYKTVVDQHGYPKWKGMIYQGFEFDNGYNMRGYSSDGKTYDSYKKLPFIPYRKCKGKKVLDIGSNQGFFSFQAAIHGASEVVGVELQKEDVLAANDIKEITGFSNVDFVHGDAIEYIMNTQDKYGLVIANSMLHQVYKNLEGAEDVLAKIGKMSDYFIFESPVRHPTTTIGLEEISEKLKDHFKMIRLLYFYDAYSTGYRANFVCYGYNVA